MLKLCRKEELVLSTGGDEVSEIIQEMSFYSKKPDQSKSNNELEENNVVGLKFKTRSEEDDNIAYQRSRAQSIRRRQSVIETVNNSFARQTDKVFSLVRYAPFLLFLRLLLNDYEM